MEEYILTKSYKHGMSEHELFQKFKKFMEEDSDIVKSENFDEHYAKSLVASMWHCDGEKKYVGEKYNHTFAKTVYEKHKAVLPENVNCWDVYVAINTQYHDFAKLYHKWFGSTIDTQIIDSAISMWFLDDDYQDGKKIYNYFED